MTQVIFHADDFGLCSPVNQGILETLPDPISSASIMAPCDGFEEAASIYHAHNKSLDIGLHFTLTTGGLVPKHATVSSASPSLLNEDGVMWTTVKELDQHAQARDVERELEAQFAKTMEAGFDITHLDAHMFVGSIPMVAKALKNAALEWRIPLVLNNDKGQQFNARLAQAGYPVFDTIVATRSAEQLKQHLSSINGGLHYVILHPAIHNDELAQKLPHTCNRRFDDYRLCIDGSIKNWISQYKLQAISMCELRDNLRTQNNWV